MNRIEFHAHLALDGVSYAQAAARHSQAVDLNTLRGVLAAYQNAGFTAVRDGGDPFGVSPAAMALAAEYGLKVASPVFAIHKTGCYGSILGKGFASQKEYLSLVQKVRREGGTFIKLVLSGIMDFENEGRQLYYEHPLTACEIREMVHAAHSEGLAVMAHVNGRDNITMALEAGCDSIEHGYGMDISCLRLMKERGSFWVPTLAPLALFQSDDPGVQNALSGLLAAHRSMIRTAASLGVSIMPGSDAGSAFVHHVSGLLSEEAELKKLLPDEAYPSEDEQTACLSRFFLY